MVAPSVGSIVLVQFPFSDLSSSKVRPAVVLAEDFRDDWILCQITSKSYSDIRAIEITETDFISGSIMRTSYARPGKLFSANAAIIKRIAGKLSNGKIAEIIDTVITIFRP